MASRRRRAPPGPAVVAAYRGFRRVVERVELAKATLLLGVPSGRSPRMPLAEALAGFEAGIAEARGAMDGWRAPEVEAEWGACRSALGEAARRAEGLRLGSGSDAYGDVLPLLDSLLDPLEAFVGAARRFRDLGT